MGFFKYVIFFFILHVSAQHSYADELTDLHKHILFFDRNKDGVIYNTETFEGKPFDARFPIDVKNIHLGIHGSDTGVYDQNGRFVASKFEEIFQKHAHTHPNALTKDELSELLKANTDPKDFKGWAAAQAEWKILFDLAKDDQGLLQRDTVRAMYDGSLFERLKKN